VVFRGRDSGGSRVKIVGRIGLSLSDPCAMLQGVDRPSTIPGRGAADNPPNRFERLHVEPDPDAEPFPDEIGQTPRPRTFFYRDATQTILNRNDSPDIPFDYSINPYRGCEHGCVYCYARPTHEYLGFSAGLDFETRIMVKTDAPALLRNGLSSPKWRPQVVAMSGVTDCYQPAERQFRITRGCLEVFAEFRNPVGIVTKNALVTRDLDLLKELARFNAAAVFVSVTTLDAELARRMEPRTASPRQRLDTIRILAEAGVPVGVMAAPMIPGLNDHEMMPIIGAATAAGAKFAGYVVLRLPFGVKDLFQDWLQRWYPDRFGKVMNRIRAVRDGKLNVAEFGERMAGTGIFAEQLAAQFKIACRKAGIEGNRPGLSAAAFRGPDRAGDQMNFGF
jgi:DNA repair photolyase